MSEPQNALGGATHTGLISITESAPRGMITLRGDLESAKLKKAVKAVAGCTVPAQRRAETKGECTVTWMSPDELLIMLPYEGVSAALEELTKGLKGEHHLAVDVSDARSLFKLEGDAIHEVLAKLAPIDLHPDSFGADDFRRTRLAQVPAAFWMAEDGIFWVVCFRSVAQYVFDLLANAAAEKGEVGVF